MKEVKIQIKQKYLEEHYPFAEIPKLTDKKECLHCGDTIAVGGFKVFKDDFGDEWIYCPNAPECDGTPLDWMPVIG